MSDAKSRLGIARRDSSLTLVRTRVRVTPATQSAAACIQATALYSQNLYSGTLCSQASSYPSAASQDGPRIPIVAQVALALDSRTGPSRSSNHILEVSSHFLLILLTRALLGDGAIQI